MVCAPGADGLSPAWARTVERLRTLRCPRQRVPSPSRGAPGNAVCALLARTDLRAVRGLAKSLGVDAPPGLAADDVDGWLNLLLALRVEPVLAQSPALFLYDYPPGQAALARIRRVACRGGEIRALSLGIEICNGYQELTDADELRRRIGLQAALRRRDGNRPLPAESRLLDAMEAGLPECAGVALGFDRLLMTAVGAASLAEVMPSRSIGPDAAKRHWQRYCQCPVFRV